MNMLLSFVFYVLVGYFEYACAGSVVLNSNAIKNIPGVVSPSHPVSASPDEFTFDSGSQNLAIDTIQVRFEPAPRRLILTIFYKLITIF